jgi:hypothetical protein
MMQLTGADVGALELLALPNLVASSFHFVSLSLLVVYVSISLQLVCICQFWYVCADFQDGWRGRCEYFEPRPWGLDQ